MQIAVDISEDFAAQAAGLGLTPEAYAREVLDSGASAETEWEA